jgi:hypothetical protein
MDGCFHSKSISRTTNGHRARDEKNCYEAVNNSKAKDNSEDTTGERDQEPQKSECRPGLRNYSWQRRLSERGRDLHGIREIRAAKPTCARPH